MISCLFIECIPRAKKYYYNCLGSITTINNNNNNIEFLCAKTVYKNITGNIESVL